MLLDLNLSKVPAFTTVLLEICFLILFSRCLVEIYIPTSFIFTYGPHRQLNYILPLSCECETVLLNKTNHTPGLRKTMIPFLFLH